MRRICLAVLGLIVLVACGPDSPEAIDRAIGDDVPEALALALVSNAAEESEIFVGSPPASLQDILPSGEGVSIMGGLTRDNGGTVVLNLAESAEATLSSYGDRLESEGWERAASMRPRGGFQRSPEPVAGTWCTETHWVWASAVSFADTEMLRLRYYEVDTEPTPCENARMTGRASIDYGLRIPDLDPPPDAEVHMTGGGGSGDGVDMSASVVSDLSAEELFEHYARQVGRAGWDDGRVSASNGLAIGQWTTSDDSGRPAIGVLAIWPVPGLNAYHAWIRLGRVRSGR